MPGLKKDLILDICFHVMAANLGYHNPIKVKLSCLVN